MDKAGKGAREHIAGMADLLGAVRLPEASMQATAGTEVVVDVLVFQRRLDGKAPRGPAWMELREVELENALDSEASSEEESFGADSDESEDSGYDSSIAGEGDVQPVQPDPEAHFIPRRFRRGVVLVNEYFVSHPEMVLGEHAQRRG